MNDYKNFFEYTRLYNFLKNNDLIKTINYENIDKEFQTIINNLNQVDKNYLNDIQKKNVSILLKLKEDKIGFDFKKVEINHPSRKLLKYINDFEIINKDICNFFIQNQIINNNNFLR